MKIAIISDIHENHHNLKLALKKIKELGADSIICLGDLMKPPIAKILAGAGLPVYCLWGNNDGEKVLIMRVSYEEGSSLKMSDKNYDFLEEDGRKIFITHYGDLVSSMAKSGDYDAIFYGHSHEKDLRKINNCLVVNPGEISTDKTGVASFALYDTGTNESQIIDIEDALNIKWED